MPIAPVVKLYDSSLDLEITPLNIIDFGEVKAGTKSKVYTLDLWNNRGGVELASTMKDVELFVLDSADGVTEPIVKDGWLKAKCLSDTLPVETEMTDLNTLPITALGQTAGEILGSINTGIATDTGNFAKIELFAHIIKNVVTATHGEKPFSLAFRYFFT